ncbi:hypothetical protein [Algoriphagus boritolerans]|uniref:hypothetical protein n=1 Tax=Algoriphagus boritolerans TaxID=308111 RepID=UPI000AFF4703
MDVVALGGFTSIILESGGANLQAIQGTKFTTGNTLTAALIADSLVKACQKWNQPLKDSTLLIIGSTGDIGSACVRYFSNKVKKNTPYCQKSSPTPPARRTTKIRKGQLSG